MGRGELTRLVPATGAALLIVVAVVVLNMAQGNGAAEEDPGPDTPVAAVAGAVVADQASDGAYLSEARALADALAEFSTQALTLLDHEPLVDGSSGLDDAAEALAQVGARNRTASPDRRGLALVADEVCGRWSELRPVALSERTAEDGVRALRAVGREAGVRAAELASILDTLSGAARRTALDAVVSRSWPAPDQEGVDTPV